MSEKRFDSIEIKIDDLKDKVSETNLHLGIYNEQLKIHIAATNQNKSDIKEIRSELEPIKQYINFLKWLVIGIVGLTSFVATIYSFFN